MASVAILVAWAAFAEVIFARPKSRIFIRPSLVTKRFSGLRSRWTDTFGVCRSQTVRYLHGIINDFSRGNCGFRQPLPQRFAFEQLRDDIENAVVRAHVIDGQNIGVVQCARSLCFLLKTAQAFRT